MKMRGLVIIIPAANFSDSDTVTVNDWFLDLTYQNKLLNHLSYNKSILVAELFFNLQRK